MFDFFFKRSKPAAVAASSKPGAQVGSHAVSQAVAKATAPDAGALRQRALAQADALGTDEAALAGFIATCGIAEVRLRAAQNIHGRAALGAVQKAMRETDRRVARLMQQRLETLDREAASQQRAQQTLEHAQALCAETALRSNQVVELERAWKAIDAPTGEAQAAFDAVHARLAQRLAAQTALQRRLLDAIARLRAVVADPATHGAAIDALAADADTTLVTVPLDAELPSLPKQLLPELARLREQVQHLQDAAAVASAAIAAREQALQAWKAALANDQPPENRPQLASMQHDWRGLPVVADVAQRESLQERFDDLVRQVVPAPPRKSTEPVDAAQLAEEQSAGAPVPVTSRHPSADLEQRRAQLGIALAALQAALDEGALQRAMEQDRLVRTLDVDSLRLPAGQQAALSAARAELGRLQGWARWGGTVSREELLAAVEALPQQALTVTELAKKVGSMRERWRALDASAGVAPRALWTRFDAACTNAYAPVAAHFAVLAQERAANAAKAQALLDEIGVFAREAGMTSAEADMDAGAPEQEAGTAPDWRAIAAFCQRMRQAWQKLGTIERKEHKRLDAAFAQALQPLLAPLAAQQTQAIAQRERLIEEVGALPPQARETPERLQGLQARWQQHAKSFPLDRQMEQTLWQRFRSACDGVFAERKNAGAAADAERNANLQIKTALCAAIEQLANEETASERERAAGLRETRRAWDAAGPVPRAAQATLQTRFDKAIHALEAQAAARQRAVAQQRYVALASRLRLCLAAERHLIHVADTAAGSAWAEQWAQLPALDAELEQPLRIRFDAAIAAITADDKTYATLLETNQLVRDTELLRLEVEYGIASPAAFVRERLALQVAGLQSALRSGASGPSQASARLQLARICSLAAMADEQAQRRLETLAEALLTSV